MSKKKPTSKKHKFKHVEPSVSSGGGANVGATRAAAGDELVSAPGDATVAPARTRQAEISADTRARFAYVGRDVRRILTVAVVLIAFEIALYGAISRTPFGDMVYRAISF